MGDASKAAGLVMQSTSPSQRCAVAVPTAVIYRNIQEYSGTYRERSQTHTKFLHFRFLALYGRWEALTMRERLPQGALTLSPPGQPHSENFLFFSLCSDFFLLVFVSGSLLYKTGVCIVAGCLYRKSQKNLKHLETLNIPSDSKYHVYYTHLTLPTICSSPSLS